MVVRFYHNPSPRLPVLRSNHPTVVCVPVVPGALEMKSVKKCEEEQKKNHLRPGSVTSVDLMHEIEVLLRHLRANVSSPDETHHGITGLK